MGAEVGMYGVARELESGQMRCRWRVSRMGGMNTYMTRDVG